MNRPLARGYCDVSSTPDPGGVVRAKGYLEPATGEVRLSIEWETDNLTRGPCGKAGVILLDANGERLYRTEMDDEGCIGGKPPGDALIIHHDYKDFVSQATVSATKSVLVYAVKTRSIFRVWNIRFNNVLDAIKLVGTVVGAVRGPSRG